MDEQFHFLLMQTFNMTHRIMQQAAAAFGLDPGQPKILRCLYPDQAYPPKQIAVCCRLDKSTGTLLIQRMEARNLLVRNPSSTDKRSILIQLSEEGKKQAEKVIEAGKALDQKALAGFSEAQINQLKDNLLKIQNSLEETE